MWKLRELIDYVNRSRWTEIDGVRMPRRPTSNPSWWNRVTAAWAVFTRRAEAFRWPGGQ